MDARTLLQQIGGGNLMAVGARAFVAGEDSLGFRVGPQRKNAQLIVKLTPADTYTVTYVALPKRGDYVTETVSDVYAENIGEVVRRMGDRP